MGRPGLDPATNGLKVESMRIARIVSLGLLTAETVCSKVCKLQSTTADAIPCLVSYAAIHLTIDARGVTRYNPP